MTSLPDIVCFSHLPWDHVFQRPHHLMTRAAAGRRVIYVEESALASRPGLSLRSRPGGILVATPLLPADMPESGRENVLAGLLDALMDAERVVDPVAWYYTPLAVPWAGHLETAAVVYDCMDELSAFRGASPRIPRLEQALLAKADVVFTGGRSRFEAKRHAHANVHAFPSAVDVEHFRAARTTGLPDPSDQAELPRPRLGWFGVIDERFDGALVDEVARLRPDWSIVLVGPTAKIDPASLPDRPNVHWLGPKAYSELPAYLAGWDVAIMPFARNEATAFISPTKTPEYLAGGRPVVSTTITDVVRPYGERGLARIADDPAEFVRACEAAMAEPAGPRIAAADGFLEGMSWDRTWREMAALVARAVDGATRPSAATAPPLGTIASAALPSPVGTASVGLSRVAGEAPRP